jgi:hypothetical protein
MAQGGDITAGNGCGPSCFRPVVPRCRLPALGWGQSQAKRRCRALAGRFPLSLVSSTIKDLLHCLAFFVLRAKLPHAPSHYDCSTGGESIYGPSFEVCGLRLRQHDELLSSAFLTYQAAGIVDRQCKPHDRLRDSLSSYMSGF